MKNLIIILIFFVSYSYGQSGYNPIGKTLARDTVLLERQLKIIAQAGAVIGGYDKAASALLDLQSTNRGLLIPRMSAAQMSAIASPATGLLIYNTSVDAFHFWNGGAWQMIGGGGGSGWELTGNAGTTAGTNFIGTTDAQDIIFKRDNSVVGHIGQFDLAFGEHSLENAAFPGSNFAFGRNCLPNVTSGSTNIGIGDFVGNSLITGAYNIIMGSSADVKDSTINNAVIIGTAAHGGHSSVSIGGGANAGDATFAMNIGGGRAGFVECGLQNIAFGCTTLVANTSGAGNIAFGNGSLANNSSGYNNIGVGVNSLGGVVTGHDNVSVGVSGGTNDSLKYSISFGTNVNAADRTISISDSTDQFYYHGNGGVAGTVFTNDGTGQASWQAPRGLTGIVDTLTDLVSGTVNLTNNKTNVIVASGTITSTTINFPDGVDGDEITIIFQQAITTLTNYTGNGTATLTKPIVNLKGLSRTYKNIGGNWY